MVSPVPGKSAQLAFVGLGANLGDARGTLAQAVRGLAALPGTRLIKVSSLWRSAPVQATGPDFLNAVAQVSTSLEPLALLDALQALEQQHGRLRPYPNAPRTLDLDLLFLGDIALRHPRLTLPHPRISERAFVWQPLAELAPEWLARWFPTDNAAAARAAQRCERLGPLPAAA